MSHIEIQLKKMIDADKNISKNQICYQCKIQRTQLNRYCNNQIVRFDLDILSKLCDFFHCQPNDILKLVSDD